jgi:hypothetical protein
MSVTAIILLALAIYLLVKVAGTLFKLGLVVVLLVSAYWLAAPFLGLRLPI